MPTLHLVQEEYGYLSRELMEVVADILGLTPVQVYEVASFYHQFRTEQTGHYRLQICTNVPCMLSGADKLVQYLEKRLNIPVGDSTADGTFTLSRVECLGSCDTAPVMQINNEPYRENLSEQQLEEILQELTRAVTQKQS
jgi:NADH-quinone oxidoreductase subunit E